MARGGVYFAEAVLFSDASEGARLLIPKALPVRPVLADPRAAEDHDGRADAMGAQRLLGLGVFDEEARPAHAVAEEEILVERRNAIGRRGELRFVARKRGLFRHARYLPGGATIGKSGPKPL